MNAPWEPDVCIYHFPCDDGFAAAWIARKRWPDVVLAPTNYGQPFPDVDIAGKNVLIADFSYKPDILAEIAGQATSIVILDHHKSAEEDLAGIDSFSGDYVHVAGVLAQCIANAGRNVVAWFDQERSGATLTWDFCFPTDRDLWHNENPHTCPIWLYLRSYPHDFAVWDEIAARLDRGGAQRAALLQEAAAIERFYDRKLSEMAPTATLKSIGKWKGVPVAHAPYAFASDLAHDLLQVHRDAPFAAVVVDAYGARTYSLRSEDSRQDVSEVARIFGGGGHRNAAGFGVPA